MPSSEVGPFGGGGVTAMEPTPARVSRRSLIGAGLLAAFGGLTCSDAAVAADWPLVELLTVGRATVRDDVGAEVELRTPMTRVAVFNRYTAEFVRAIAGPRAIIGVGSDTLREADYWPNLRAASIGQGQSAPNFEAIVALKPDAVFFPRNSDWATARAVLAPFGIPVVVLTAWDVLKHEANVDLLGQLFGERGRAAELNGFYRAIRDRLAQRTAGQRRPRIYFEEVGAYKTVLKGSGWHDMIEASGGENIFGRLTETSEAAARGNNQSFDIDPEEILARQPEVIVKLQPNQYAPHSAAFSEAVLRSVAARPGFETLPAVRTGRVYHLSYYLAGACSKIVGALQIATWLAPDRFTDEDADAAMRTWLEHFQGVPDPGGYWHKLGGAGP